MTMRHTTVLAAIGFVVGATFSACNDPKVEIEPEGYRQYAEEWCTEFHQIKAECGQSYSNAEQRLAWCIQRQDWDWTDACGAKIWEARQCLTSHGCAFDPLHPSYEEECERDAAGSCIHPCQEHFNAVHSCPRGVDENGLPYGTLG
jgi:hypothetical protein